MPILFSAMSYGSISYNAHRVLWPWRPNGWESIITPERADSTADFYRYGKNTIVQVASGRFGVHKEYLDGGRGHRD